MYLSIFPSQIIRNILLIKNTPENAGGKIYFPDPVQNPNFSQFPLIIGINQAGKRRTGIVLPPEKAWLPIVEFTKPQIMLNLASPD